MLLSLAMHLLYIIQWLSSAVRRMAANPEVVRASHLRS